MSTAGSEIADSEPGVERSNSTDVRLPDTAKLNSREVLLRGLRLEVDRTGASLEEAHRARELHQKRLNEMLEGTLRQIQKARSHMKQQARSVRETTKSYSTKIEHDFSCMCVELRQDFSERAKVIDGTLEGLSGRLTDLEQNLNVQREERITQTREILEPIRVEVNRLTNALEKERKDRRLQEEQREKDLEHQVEEITRLIDAEKFAREQQVAGFERAKEKAEQQLAKRQYEAEQAIQTKVRLIRGELQEAAKTRISDQNGIVESIASFIRRYRKQVHKDTEFFSNSE
jgi:hypothetical protein